MKMHNSMQTNKHVVCNLKLDYDRNMNLNVNMKSPFRASFRRKYSNKFNNIEK